MYEVSGYTLDSLRELNVVSIIFRFALTMLCGGLIGYERGKNNQAAGLRTHLAICMGAAVTMMTSQYISSILGQSTDPSRLGAQVITGVGFIGVGTIVTGRKMIRGLTTAASVWATACMGLAIGVGFYEGGIVMCAMLYATLEWLNRFDRRYLKTMVAISMYIEYDRKYAFSTILQEICAEGWKTTAMEFVGRNKGDVASMMVTIKSRTKNQDGEALIEKIRMLDCVIFIEEI